MGKRIKYRAFASNSVIVQGCAMHQTLPHALCLLWQHRLGFRIEHIPEAALDLLLKFAGLPYNRAGEEPRPLGLGLDNVANRIRRNDEKQIRRKLDRAAAGILMTRHQREDGFDLCRPAEIKPGAEGTARTAAGKRIRER